MDLAPLVAILGTAVACALVVRWRAARAAAARSRRARSVGRAAVDGERAAVPLLRAAGYRVVGEQVRHAMTVTVDGTDYDAGLRCDYLVERDGTRWVAEVKTGDAAPSLANPATRRQLLEYQVAYGVDGVVLVDADAGEIHAVRFALAPPAAPGSTWRSFTLGAVTGAVALAAGAWWLG